MDYDRKAFTENQVRSAILKQIRLFKPLFLRSALYSLFEFTGVSSSIRELKKEIKEGKEIEWESYSPHVFTAVLKSFFRELPEPLLTFDLYDEFLRAADLSLYEDRVHTIFAILKKLPKPNYDLMERLVFHLVR